MIMTSTFQGKSSRIQFSKGHGGLPTVRVATPWSTAEIYLYGAHIASFQKQDEPPLLFLSECSSFMPGKPIRGGIPIIFPWFGPAEGKPSMHGYARTRNWELTQIVPAADGSVSLGFRLPDSAESAEAAACAVEYIVTVADTLSAELAVTNESKSDFVFEDCLHTYFTVGDITTVSMVGLKGVDYLDKVEGFKRKTETNDVIRVGSEVDRVYLDTRQTVEIRDGSLKRVIRVEKENSVSTVVWNPWMVKAKAMPDFGDDEYQRMVCVESGNVSLGKTNLAPGQTSHLKVKYSTVLLK